MHELKQDQFASVKHFLPIIKCDTVFAYSIVENRQKGRILVDDPNDPQTVLFWHYCGLSVVAGKPDNSEFNSALKRILCRNYEENQRVFLLWVNEEVWNSTVASLLSDSCGVVLKDRIRFRFNRKIFSEKNISVPDGYELKEIDADIIDRIEGHIIPSYSWHSSEAFLSEGKGYCLLDGAAVACNSFSSAIGNGILDIGIETMQYYRFKGLAAPTAAAMVKYCLDNGFEPSWGCNAENIGSSRIAQSVGFEIIDSHPMYVSP